MEGLSTRKLELLPVNNLQLSPKTPVQYEIKKKKKRGREKCLDLMLHLVTGNRGRVIWKRRDRVDPRKPSRSRDKAYYRYISRSTQERWVPTEIPACISYPVAHKHESRQQCTRAQFTVLFFFSPGDKGGTELRSTLKRGSRCKDDRVGIGGEIVEPSFTRYAPIPEF